MNKRTLAEKMLEYGDVQARAQELKKEIEAAVMDLKATQIVGNVRATYRNPRKKYDYKYAVLNFDGVDEALVEEYTVQPDPKTDWRKVCTEAGIDIESIPFKESKAGVTIKIE